MRRLFHTLLCILVLLPSAASCLGVDSQPPVVAGDAPVALRPYPHASTKAPIDGTVMPFDRTLTVSAQYDGGDGQGGVYFTDAPFAHGTDTWVASGTRRWWPFSGTLDFLLWSADGLAVTASHPADVSSGAVLAVPDNGDVQCDILVGSLRSQRRIEGGNPVVMRHAEACLAFIAEASVGFDEAANAGVTIEGIVVEGAAYSGTLTVDPSSAAGSQCRWDDLASVRDKALPMAEPYPVPAASGASLGSFGIGATGLLVPEQAQTSFVVSYTLHSGYDDAGNEVSQASSFRYACDGDWEEGRKYVYSLVFALNEITIVPTVVNWDDDLHHEGDYEIRCTGSGIPEYVGADFSFAPTDVYRWRPDASASYVDLTVGGGAWGSSVTWRTGNYEVTLNADGASYAFSYRRLNNDEPITFEVLTAGTLSWKDMGLGGYRYYDNAISAYRTLDASTVEVSVNGGPWSEVTATSSGAVLAAAQAGDVVRVRGTGKATAFLTDPSNYMSYPNDSYFKYTKFVFSGGLTAKVRGSVGSVVLGADYTDEDIASLGLFSRCTPFLFDGCTGLVDASGLSLDSRFDGYGTWHAMFRGCAALAVAPATIPATAVRTCNSMFQNCTALTQAPELPATTLVTCCYCSMFQGCTSLSLAPELPATVLDDGCYKQMFSGCTALRTAPELPATTMKNECYQQMFYGCTALTAVPELPATTMARYCYGNMFASCTALTSVPASLPATTLAESCYSGMFSGCTALTRSPELPATVLAGGCYNYMFGSCRSLTAPPDLPAAYVPQNGYYCMFSGCTALVTAGAILATGCASYSFYQMFYGCTALVTAPPTVAAVPDAGSGYTAYQMFYNCPRLVTAPRAVPANGRNGGYQAFYNCTALVNGPDEILGGEYGEDCCYQMFYGCYRMTSAPEIRATSMPGARACYQMFYNCSAMVTPPSELAFETVSVNGCAYMFASCTSLASTPEFSFPAVAQGGCSQMFQGCRALASAHDLPAMTLDKSCYSSMFSGCTALTSAPELPATALADNCYQQMFNNCTSLTQAPELPAMRLAVNCYNNMFASCRSLAQAPVLPATTLAQGCYGNMFAGCTSLTQAPVLPATTLVQSCYGGMFYNCTSLTQAPVLPVTTLAPYCYSSMFSRCTSLTQAPVLPAMTLANNCYDYMFSRCTSLAQAPALPATTLANSCYSGMFSDCTALTQAPVLPATTLASSCYEGMFRGCTALAVAPALPTTVLANRCYLSMFQGCTALVAGPDLPAPSLYGSCYNNMFSGCTSLSSVKMMAVDAAAYQALSAWLYNVSSTGTITVAAARDWDIAMANVPAGWTVVEE